VLDRYCTDCHNDAELAGELSFQGRLPENVSADTAVWEKVVHQLAIGAMPPRDQPQPDAEERQQFLAALVGTLDAHAASKPFTGATSVHRLTRAEYANAVRDVLGVEANVAELLPGDGENSAFGSIAEALTASPLLLERYIAVALRVADMAIGNPDAIETSTSYPIAFGLTQSGNLEGMPLGTRGGVRVRHTFPADGEYVLSGRLVRGVAEGLFGVEGHDRPHDFLILVDGKTVYSSEIAGKEDHELSLARGYNVAETSVNERLTSPPIPITAGTHELIFTWSERASVPQNTWRPGLRATMDLHNTSGMPRLENVVIDGPANVTGVSQTPSREQIFVCRPATASHEPACVDEILLRLTRKAFRRPVTADDIEATRASYDDARAEGGDFDAGIRAAVARLLVSPWFLFRVESSPEDSPTISDVELAARLSLFLWSSVPDEELLGLAEQGTLREANALEQQVSRMLVDPRSSAFIETFVGEWLQLSALDDSVRPDFLLYPDFDDNLRQAFRRETDMLFAHVLREGRPVHELINANYTFANERLARHYGIAGVYGSRFRKVELQDPNRWGLFGHGSILSLTSTATRTSPTTRGKFVATEFWNNPPAPPPKSVPALEAQALADRPSTVREQLERHRADPTCNACHAAIDPLGFALERFDADGSWRDAASEGLEIDSTGILTDGTAVDGPIALREALLAKPELFAGTVSAKMLAYALGRGLEPADMPVVRSIVRRAAENDYSLRSIVLAVAASGPFQSRANP
jgi:hypothetical protein